jgi:hypothetical protein
MTNESGEPEQRRWLVEPPGPQDVKVHIATGDQFEMTLEIPQAFDSFIEALGGGSETIRGAALDVRLSGSHESASLLASISARFSRSADWHPSRLDHA